jgi:hypothetical protein
MIDNVAIFHQVIIAKSAVSNAESSWVAGNHRRKLVTVWLEILHSGTIFPVCRIWRRSLLIGDGNCQGSTRRAAADGEIEETNASWGSSGGRLGGMAREGDIPTYYVTATRATACKAGSNTATARGGGNGVAGSGNRYRQSGGVERTAYATDGESSGRCGSVVSGNSLLHSERLAVGYGAVS